MTPEELAALKRNLKPWEVPQSDAPPGFHRMPDGSLMRDSSMPPPAMTLPQQPDPLALAQELSQPRQGLGTTEATQGSPAAGYEFLRKLLLAGRQ